MAIYFGNNKVTPSGIKSVYFGNNKVYEEVTYPAFADATWTQVKAACQAGVCATIWNVGDTKTMVAADGTTYTIRIADMTPNRYAYADGSRSSNAVFEFVECVKNDYTTDWQMNTATSSIGGWAAMPLKTLTLPALQSVILPFDLQNLLVEVSILSLTMPAIMSQEVGLSANKLFLPARYEISTGTEQMYRNEVPKGIWQYYDGKGDADRIKYEVGTSQSWGYWMRSAEYNSNTSFFLVNNDGSTRVTSTVTNPRNVSPCFAF